jgi:hypothetical protein
MNEPMIDLREGPGVTHRREFAPAFEEHAALQADPGASSPRPDEPRWALLRRLIALR